MEIKDGCEFYRGTDDFIQSLVASKIVENYVIVYIGQNEDGDDTYSINKIDHDDVLYFSPIATCITYEDAVEVTTALNYL
jgi:hypothetical protein